MSDANYQKTLLDIQKKYQDKMTAAVSEDGAVNVDHIILEMQAEIEAVINKMQAGQVADILTAAQEQSQKVYDSSLSKLDLDNLAYFSDYQFFKELPSKENYVAALQRANSDLNLIPNSRKSLLTTAMRLSENVSKPFFKIVNRCREILHFEAPLEIYVVPDSLFNAAVMPIVDGKVIMYFTSSLLEKFSEDELAFVIGHEMGHAMFGHINIPVNSLMNYPDLLTGRDLIKIKSWQRSAELSADRAGLLCAQNFEAACTAFFKLSSGITSDKFKFNVDDYINQYSDLEFYLKNSTAENFQEVYSSHPLNPLRLKALAIFKESNVYFNLTQKSSNGISLKAKNDIESEIKSFMSIMEPNYLDDESAVAENLRTFIFESAFMIANANGVIDPLEVNQICSLTNDPNALQKIEELKAKDQNEIIQNLIGLSKKLNMDLMVIQKTNLLRDLMIVCSADGSVTTDEMNVVYNVANLLVISPYFIDELVRESNIIVEPAQPIAA